MKPKSPCKDCSKRALYCKLTCPDNHEFERLRDEDYKIRAAQTRAKNDMYDHYEPVRKRCKSKRKDNLYE